jgi:hypothetical protein
MNHQGMFFCTWHMAGSLTKEMPGTFNYVFFFLGRLQIGHDSTYLDLNVISPAVDAKKMGCHQKTAGTVVRSPGF